MDMQNISHSFFGFVIRSETERIGEMGDHRFPDGSRLRTPFLD